MGKCGCSVGEGWESVGVVWGKEGKVWVWCEGRKGKCGCSAGEIRVNLRYVGEM